MCWVRVNVLNKKCAEKEKTKHLPEYNILQIVNNYGNHSVSLLDPVYKLDCHFFFFNTFYNMI